MTFQQLTTTLALLIFPLILSAQLTDGMVRYDKQNYNSLRLTVDAPADEVEDRWEDFWDDRYDVDLDKLDKDRNSIAQVAEQVNVSILSPKTLNLYSKITDANGRSDVALAVVFSPTDVVTRSAYPDAYRATETLLNEFRTYFYTKYFDEQIADVRDDLEDMRDDSQDDSKDAEKARRKIEKYREKIADYEEKIVELREEAGDELESSEEKARKAEELQTKLRDLEARRTQYLRG